MADSEPRNDEQAPGADAPEPVEGEAAAQSGGEEPAGREAEDQPADVQGEETVVEDEQTSEQDASPAGEDAPGEPAPSDAAAEQAPSDVAAEPAEPAEAPGPAEGVPDDVPVAAEDPESTESTEPAAPVERRPRPERSGEGEKKPDVVPGAELEPIAIEPERELSAEERARLEAEAEERARLEAEATAEEAEPDVQREASVAVPDDATIQATGKRKSSIARVIVRAGSGQFSVNGRELDEYFPRPYLRTVARQPLVTAGYQDSIDVRVRVHGGGVSGQAGAVRHGIARALTEIDPELRGELKRRGLLTRDARAKERRKAGLKKARKRPQFSKR